MRISIPANLAPHCHKNPNQTTTTKHSNRERGRETNEVVEMQRNQKKKKNNKVRKNVLS